MAYALAYITVFAMFALAQTMPQTWAEKYGPQEDMPFLDHFRLHIFPIPSVWRKRAIHMLSILQSWEYPLILLSRTDLVRGLVLMEFALGHDGSVLMWDIRQLGVPVIPFDIPMAMDQIDTAYNTLIRRPVATENNFSANTTRNAAKDGKPHPRIITLGGDHAVILPILRSLYSVYGEIAVVHFDSHLDTWPVQGFYGATNNTVTHGTMFWTAMNEGLIAKGNSIHAGIRCMMTGYRDIQNDQQVGFSMITTDDIEELERMESSK
ncbi:arginase family [Rhizoctonia solani]|uniref:Arginase family n=1 Tax=Rhizoctonia solani TaxID=456999 RepID=A0A8H7IMB3_9AGAM|nr:arginase family [Rhizoctonia solani]